MRTYLVPAFLPCHVAVLARNKGDAVKRVRYDGEGTVEHNPDAKPRVSEWAADRTKLRPDEPVKIEDGSCASGDPIPGHICTDCPPAHIKTVLGKKRISQALHRNIKRM